MPNISEIRHTLKKIRVKAVNELVSIMKKHDRKEVETYEFDDTPIVIDSNIDIRVNDTYTLDTIRVVNNTKPYLIFGCSSSYDRKEVTSNNIFIDNLIEILDWVLSYENFIFESED